MAFLRRIFRREVKRPPADRAATAPLDPETLEGEVPQEGRHHVTVGASHSKGMQRDQDDDSLLVVTGGSDGDHGLPDFGLFCVADGLGGYKDSDLASAIAVKTVARRLTQGIFVRLMDLDPGDEDTVPYEIQIRQAFKAAHQTILERANGGATTLTVALLLGEQIVLGHAGDTRAYFIEDDRVECLTQDHSLAREMSDSGVMTEKERQQGAYSNVLLNALGKPEDPEVDVSFHVVPVGGHMLICTDGLWGVLSEDEILEKIEAGGDPQRISDQLVETALESGGSDNISAILAYFPV
jgi:serine/threonine protein phosphatase PrpC